MLLLASLCVGVLCFFFSVFNIHCIRTRFFFHSIWNSFFFFVALSRSKKSLKFLYFRMGGWVRWMLTKKKQMAHMLIWLQYWWENITLWSPDAQIHSSSLALSILLFFVLFSIRFLCVLYLSFLFLSNPIISLFLIFAPVFFFSLRFFIGFSPFRISAR